MPALVYCKYYHWPLAHLLLRAQCDTRSYQPISFPPISRVAPDRACLYPGALSILLDFAASYIQSIESNDVIIGFPVPAKHDRIGLVHDQLSFQLSAVGASIMGQRKFQCQPGFAEIPTVR